MNNRNIEFYEKFMLIQKGLLQKNNDTHLISTGECFERDLLYL